MRNLTSTGLWYSRSVSPGAWYDSEFWLLRYFHQDTPFCGGSGSDGVRLCAI